MKRLYPKILLLLLFTVLICHSRNNVFAQNISDHLYSADALFQEGNYYSAAQYYLLAYQLDSSRLKNALKYADCCRLFYSYEEAARMYKYIISRDEKNKLPEAIYFLGMMYKNLGQYEDAIKSFQHYILVNKNTKDQFYNRAVTETDACTWAAEAIKIELPVQIKHPGSPINSDLSDFGAVQMGDSLLFFTSSTTQHIYPEDSASLINSLTKIFNSRITPASLSTPTALPAKVNDPEMHNANICFASNHQVFFFTRCADERRPDLQCQLYMMYWRKGKWQKPVRLNNSINYPGSTSTQPSIAHGEKEDILYFVSDRPGGFGGKDIWYAVLKKNQLSKPSNLGSIINTAGDEITPFYDNKMKKLYFSSDTHKGFGGFDIFRSNGSYNQWTTPENIGYPLNTSYNDLYYTVNENDSGGYLTSNRPGSFYIKSQTCCNDIWEYKYVAISLPIIVDNSTRDTLPKDQQAESNENNEEIIRKFLPLSLYFHNDEPDPATKKESTQKNYRTTVADYFILKDKYKEEYSKGIKGSGKLQAQQDIEDFFREKVLNGMKQLEEFTAYLEKDLKNGNSVTITIKGFSSPLNSAEYNKALAKRRIISLINYFREYENGSLLPYIRGTASGNNSLSFREEPIGEEQASKLVSDNPNDKRNSIYSRSAALERRIQILYYEGRMKKK